MTSPRYLLYYSPDSANLPVRMALEECGAPYRTELVDRSQGQQRSEEYLSLNPQGLIPVLVDGETAIFETAAILLHLADHQSGLGPKPFETGRAEFYRLLFYLSNTVHADLRALFYPHRHLTDERAAPALQTGSQARLLQHLSLLDKQLAKSTSGYLLDTGFSVCDIYLATCCRWLLTYPAGLAVSPDKLQALPALWGLLSRLEQRPAVTRACEQEWIEAPYLTAPRMPEPPVGSVTG